MNPFGGPGSPGVSGVPDCPVANAGTKPNCYGWGQTGTEPNNASNMVTAQVGVDLPGFIRNRYMGTFSYNAMTQNESFIPMTINSAGVNGFYPLTLNSNGTVATGQYLSPMPRSSLEGQIDTTLSNNVITTQLLPNLQNKLTYRYYSDQNNTPPLTLSNWIVNDTAIASSSASSIGGGSYAPHTTLFQSYTKQDASEQLTWNPASWATLGGSIGWEQYNYSETAANETNEFQANFFATGHPTDWLAIRFNELLAWRSYKNYNWQQFVGNVMLGGCAVDGHGHGRESLSAGFRPRQS